MSGDTGYITRDGRTFLIRQPRVEDAERLIEYSRLVFASTDQLLTTLEEYTITPANEKMWISGMVENPDNYVVLAEIENTIIGFLFFVGNTKSKTSHTGEFGVNVHPDFQGLGVGRALVEQMLAWATSHQKIEKVYLTVFASNVKAIKLYQSLGFVEEGRYIKGARQLNGAYVDILQMYRETV